MNPLERRRVGRLLDREAQIDRNLTDQPAKIGLVVDYQQALRGHRSSVLPA